MNYDNDKSSNTKGYAGKAIYAQAGDLQGGGLGGALMEDTCRASLRESVSSQIHRATRESARLNRLAELNALLDKYPEIARMLDLIEEVRG